ncbi:hypothetical protein KM043_011478 [Ampulex compressa]|nr:hypothetical protein KM043_011478 [Ampulex compressa]
MSRVSAKSLKSINWQQLLSVSHESMKPEITKLKLTYEECLKRMSVHAETAPKIDWAYYKQHIATPGLAEKFQKEYEALKIPYPADTHTAKVEERQKATSVMAESAIQNLHEKKHKIEKDIEAIKSELSPNEMTLEQFVIACPNNPLNPETPSIWPHTPEVQEAAAYVKKTLTRK